MKTYESRRETLIEGSSKCNERSHFCFREDHVGDAVHNWVFTIAARTDEFTFYNMGLRSLYSYVQDDAVKLAQKLFTFEHFIGHLFLEILLTELHNRCLTAVTVL